MARVYYSTIYYFAAYSGGECILKLQSKQMTVHQEMDTNYTVVQYTDDDGYQQLVTLSPNTVWTLEQYYRCTQPKIISSNTMI